MSENVVGRIWYCPKQKLIVIKLELFWCLYYHWVVDKVDDTGNIDWEIGKIWQRTFNLPRMCYQAQSRLSNIIKWSLSWSQNRWTSNCCNCMWLKCQKVTNKHTFVVTYVQQVHTIIAYDRKQIVVQERGNCWTITWSMFNTMLKLPNNSSRGKWDHNLSKTIEKFNYKVVTLQSLTWI